MGPYPCEDNTATISSSTPIREMRDDKSPIEEYVKKYTGDGAQHTGGDCNDIYATVEQLRKNGLEFMPTLPDTYYMGANKPLPENGASVERLQQNSILIDQKVS